jgi:intracellular multiplication protein IcmO
MTLDYEKPTSGERTDSDTLNPFASRNADVIRNLLVSQLEPDPLGGHADDTRVFTERAANLMGDLTPALVWIRDAKGVSLNAGCIRSAVELECIATLVDKKRFIWSQANTGEIHSVDVADMPAELLSPLRVYLDGLGGYDTRLPFDQQTSVEPLRQHGYVLLSFPARFASSLA